MYFIFVCLFVFTFPFFYGFIIMFGLDFKCWIRCWLDYFHLFLSDLASVFFSIPPSPPFLVNDSDSDVFLPEVSGKILFAPFMKEYFQFFFSNTSQLFFFLHGISVWLFYFSLCNWWSALHFKYM